MSNECLQRREGKGKVRKGGKGREEGQEGNAIMIRSLENTNMLCAGSRK